MARQKIIVGNWKMNTTFDEAAKLAQDILAESISFGETQIIICPPYINIPVVKPIFDGTPFKLGAQDIYTEEKGAFTGKISGEMIRSHGVEYVIIGHSELRQYSGDTDEIVNFKIKTALKSNLIPIVCVGEKLNERDSNKYKEVIDTQVRKALEGIDKESLQKFIIAYEPVWAIGTGLSAMPAHANEINKLIREILTELYGREIASTIHTIYGGSINSENIQDFMAEEEIDGAIMGGASLKPDEFAAIVKVASL